MDIYGRSRSQVGFHYVLYLAVPRSITRVVTQTKVTTKHGSTEITIPRMGKVAIIIMQKRRDNQTTNLADADIWASDQLMKCQLHVCPSASVSAGVITYRISQSKSETRTQIRSQISHTSQTFLATFDQNLRTFIGSI